MSIPNSSALLRVVLASSIVLCGAASIAGAEETLPAVYTQELAGRLTPIETVLEPEAVQPGIGDSGMTLLNERLVWVDEVGRRTTVWHLAYKTLTDAAVRSNGEEIFSFRKGEQRAHVVRAETIQSDGIRQPVQPNAILVQSPQRQAEYSLYDDVAELKIIFPNVKPGSVTHAIVVVEDLEAKIPGEFSQSFAWGGSWSVERLRFELNVPKALAGRLRIETLGGGIPARVTTREDDRVVHAWSLTGVLGVRYELSSPPPLQVGPAILTTTLRSWNDIGRWYRGLLAGRDELSPDLAAEVDQWTDGLRGRDEIIAALHARVADDVRYVGLEFGAADYQPHNCNDVWRNRYGDCKDKANLLVAMLRHRGIKAFTALINTEHAGLVDRRIPDYRAFDHAIVAIPRGNSGYTFCDPTIAFSVPGMLGPGSSDRFALVVRDHDADWARTPAAKGITLDYQFDLALTEAGELNGWLTITSGGYYGAADRRRFDRLEPYEMRSEMSRVLRGFYAGAEVVDAVRVDSERSMPFVAKCYFTVPGRPAINAGPGKQVLAFPNSRALFVNVGDRPERRTSYFMYPDRITVRATFSTPPNLRAEKVAPEYRFATPVANTRAAWKIAEGRIEAELDCEMAAMLVKAEEFGRFYRAMQSLQTWLDEPLVLGTSATAAPATIVQQELDFPLMPTGDGQIELVDRRYPESGSADLRRRALERTLQYFPDDKMTVFRVHGRLAYLDWSADRNQEAHERLRPLLATSVGHIHPETYAWAEMTNGLALRDLKRSDEARVVFTKIARDGTVSGERRARAAVEAADLMRHTAAEDALALLHEVGSAPDGATTELEAKIANLYLRLNRRGELRSHLLRIRDGRPDRAEEDFAAMLEYAGRWKDDGDSERIAQLLEEVQDLFASPGERLMRELTQTRRQAALSRVHAQMAEVLRRPAFAPWHDAEAKWQSLDAFDEEIAAADETSDGPRGLRAAILSLAKHGIDAGFPRRLWRAANYADWVERQQKEEISDDVCSALLDLCDELPPDDDYYFEGRLLRASRFGRTNRRRAEQIVLRGILRATSVDSNFTVAAARRLATSLVETSSDYRGAAEIHRELEPFATTHRMAAEGLLEAVFIQLHLADDAEALRLIGILAKVPAETLKGAAGQGQIVEFVRVAESGRAREIWRAGREWWPKWRRLTAKWELGENPAEVLPVISNLVELGQSLGTAKENRDRKTYATMLGKAVAAARWLPSMALELAALNPTTYQVFPADAGDLRRLVIAVLAAPFDGGMPNVASRQLQLAANYFDEGQIDEARATISAFEKAHPIANDAVGRAMRRVKALAALAANSDLEGCAAALENDLHDRGEASYRVMTVELLADVRRRLKQTAAEEELLRRELSLPATQADKAGALKLQARLDELAGNKKFGPAVAAWLAALDLPWFDHAQPRTLDDPQLRNLESLLDQPPSQYVGTERVKFYLLVARDSDLSNEKRREALREGAWHVLRMARTYSALHTAVESFLANPDFDRESKLWVLWFVLQQTFDEPAEHFNRWRDHALVAELSESFKGNVALAGEWVDTKRASSADMLLFVERMSSREVSSFGVQVSGDVLKCLLRQKDFSAAEQLAASVENWRFAPQANRNATAVRLDFSRRIRRAREMMPVHDALVGALREKFPERGTAMPDAYRELRAEYQVPELGQAETLEACLHLIAHHAFDVESFGFWRTCLRSLTPRETQDGTIAELVAAAVKAAPNDEIRAAILEELSSAVDLDDEPLRTRVAEIVAPYRDAAAHPLTAVRCRYFDWAEALRLGDLDRAENLLAGWPPNDANGHFVRRLGPLRIAMQRQSGAAVRQIVSSMTTDTLLDPYALHLSLPAFELLEMREEVEAARHIARRSMQRELVEAWATHADSAVMIALELMRVGKLGAELPPGWSEDLGTSLANPLTRYALRTQIAFEKQDWLAVEEAAATLNRDYPTHYRYYWHRGFAAYQRNDLDGARSALEVYCRYAKNEAEYPAALAILRELSARVAEAR